MAVDCFALYVWNYIYIAQRRRFVFGHALAAECSREAVDEMGAAFHFNTLYGIVYVYVPRRRFVLGHALAAKG